MVRNSLDNPSHIYSIPDQNALSLQLTNRRIFGLCTNDIDPEAVIYHDKLAAMMTVWKL